MTLTAIFQNILICQTIPLKTFQFLVSSSLLQTALNAKHWKSASFSDLLHFILLDLTSNLITYSSFLIALLFFSKLALVLLFSFYFVKLGLTLLIPVASPLFLCIRIHLSFIFIHFKFFTHGYPVNQERLLFRGPCLKS